MEKARFSAHLGTRAAVNCLFQLREAVNRLPRPSKLSELVQVLAFCQSPPPIYIHNLSSTVINYLLFPSATINSSLTSPLLLLAIVVLHPILPTRSALLRCLWISLVSFRMLPSEEGTPANRSLSFGGIPLNQVQAYCRRAVPGSDAIYVPLIAADELPISLTGIQTRLSFEEYDELKLLPPAKAIFPPVAYETEYEPVPYTVSKPEESQDSREHPEPSSSQDLTQSGQPNRKAPCHALGTQKGNSNKRRRLCNHPS